jgi:hypothetical protein
LALSSFWKSTLELRKRFPVVEATRDPSGKKDAVLEAGWKFKNVLGGGGFEVKRVGITSSINKKVNVRNARADYSYCARGPG